MPNDPSQVSPLLDQIDHPIGQVTADGAYDGDPSYTYQTIAAHGDDIAMVIPRSTAVLSGEPGPTQRDSHLAMIAEQGRLVWQVRLVTDNGQQLSHQPGVAGVVRRVSVS